MIKMDMPSRDQCKEFYANPTVNPLTGRKIKLDGPTHTKLKLLCGDYDQRVPSAKRSWDYNKPKTPKNLPKTPKSVRKSAPKSAPKLRKNAVMYINGLGCHTLDPYDNAWLKNKIVSATSVSTSDAHVFCNLSVSKTLANIAKTYCSIRPSFNDAFVKSITSEIEKYFDKNYHVYVLGHSYGGTVASRIAEFFNSNPKAQTNLHVATFGSIYVPNPQYTNNIEVKHFMKEGDVALKCNGLKLPTFPFDTKKVYDDKTKVFWEKTSVKLTKRHLLGKIDNWEVHNSYFDEMFDYLRLIKKYIV